MGLFKKQKKVEDVFIDTYRGIEIYKEKGSNCLGYYKLKTDRNNNYIDSIGLDRVIKYIESVS